MSSALSDLFSPLVARLTGDPSASASSSSSSSSLLRGVERAAALLFAALLVVSFLPIGPNAGSGESPQRAAVGVMMNAPLAAVAMATGEDEAALIARMQAAGYEKAAPDVSLRTLSEGNKGRLMGGMKLALSPPE